MIYPGQKRTQAFGHEARFKHDDKKNNDGPCMGTYNESSKLGFPKNKVGF